MVIAMGGLIHVLPPTDVGKLRVDEGFLMFLQRLNTHAVPGADGGAGK